MCKVLQKTSKDLRVFTVEAQQLVWSLAPRDWIGKRKAAIASVDRKLGWPFSRTWNIAHGRARVIRAEEWIRLNDEAAALKQSARERQEALHDLDLVARAAVAARREAARPMGMDGDEQVDTRPHARRPAA